MKIPPAFASLEEYDKYLAHTGRLSEKNSLLKEADSAIAWGYPDNESTGYSHGQFISLIQRLRNYIRDNVP